MPKVSIIMGVYNCAHSLPIAIESVLKQSFTDWELIMCNDGSRDNTFEVANEYAKKYPGRIIVLNNPQNMKLAATLNNCLSVAKGQYIARMDADDYCLPTRLEKEVAYLDLHPDVDCVGAGMIIFDEEGEKGVRLNVEYPDKNFLVHTTPFAHPTIMMRKSVYDTLEGYTVSPKIVRGEDADLWFRFYANGFKGYNIQEPLYCYHESIDDFKKVSFKTSYETFMVSLRGYRLLKYPIWKYVYALKPFIVFLIPNKFMYKYHQLKDKALDR